MAKKKVENEILESMKEIFQNEIPSGKDIASDAVTNILRGHEEDTDWIKNNFSLIVSRVQTTAYEEYLKQEKLAGGSAIIKVFSGIAGRDASGDKALSILAENFTALDKFFLSLAQGRKARAGSAFELLLRTLFEKLDYPFTSQAVINGKPDFILPSIEHYHRNPMDCIIFTVKRTLRERWRQIVTEGTRGLGFYLATIDDNVSENELGEMLKSRIYLVVPDEMKDGIEHYRDAVNVITFSKFFRDQLDPGMRRWRANGVI